jgi:hypothetical protein
VAYKLQLPPEMSAIFNVFHVSQLKKCLRDPEERVDIRNIKLQSDLTYEARPVSLIDSKETVTQNRVVKFHKMIWSNKGSEVTPHGKLRIIYSLQILGRDFYKGEGL